MTIPKALLFILCAAVILAALSHWFDQNKIIKSNIINSIQNIPEKEQINDFVTAISAADSKNLKELLDKLGAKNSDIFVKAFERGSVTNIWGLQKDEEVTRIALEMTTRYHKDFATPKSCRALFVFRLQDSKWQIEWYFPGAILLPPEHKK